MKFGIISNLTFSHNSPLSRQFDLHNIRDVKAVLMRIISAIIDKNSWFQAEAARILKIDQAGISRIKRLKIAGFSLERIFLFLLRLNCEIDLVINVPEDITTIRVHSNMKDTKIAVMYVIINIITKHRLSQAKIAKLTSTDQAKICHINMLRTDYFKIEYLLNILAKLGCSIEILVKERVKLETHSN